MKLMETVEVQERNGSGNMGVGTVEKRKGETTSQKSYASVDLYFWNINRYTLILHVTIYI